MGEYFLICNHNKRQYIHPHRFDEGAKLLEFTRARRTMFALAYLLGPNGYQSRYEGSWRDDPVGIHGDQSGDVYDLCRHGDEYRDISLDVSEEIVTRYAGLHSPLSVAEQLGFHRLIKDDG